MLKASKNHKLWLDSFIRDFSILSIYRFLKKGIGENQSYKESWLFPRRFLFTSYPRMISFGISFAWWGALSPVVLSFGSICPHWEEKSYPKLRAQPLYSTLLTSLTRMGGWVRPALSVARTFSWKSRMSDQKRTKKTGLSSLLFDSLTLWKCPKSKEDFTSP